jgi:D-aspartate ligase
MKFTHHRPGAVILGGSFCCVEAARNLTQQGVKVCALGSATSVARFSRSVGLFLRWPKNLRNDEIPECLVKISEKCGLRGWVLFPLCDEHLRIVAQQRPLLAKHYVLTTPSWETVKFLYDKRLTYMLAQKAGIPIPRTHVPENIDELAVMDFDFPVVLKPAVTSCFLKRTNRKAVRADNLRELQSLYKAISKMIDPSQIMIQDFLPKPSRNLFSFAGYFREGQPIVGLTVKRTRQLPMDFGRTSTFVETVEVPELRKLASQLLGALRYTGLAEVEFMWNEKRARFELLEVNARLWAWHGLANAAGLNLPYAAFTNSIDQNAAFGATHQGIKWVRFLTDIRAAAEGICSGEFSLRQYLTSLHGPKVFALFSMSDPMPFITEPFLLLFDRLNQLALTKGATFFHRSAFRGKNESWESRRQSNRRRT